MQAFGRSVEQRRQCFAKLIDDAARQRRANTLDLRSQITLERVDPGRPHGLEILHTELLTKAWMLLEMTAEAQARANLDNAEFADHRNALPSAVIIAPLDHGDDVTARIVDVKNLVEGAF